MKLIQHILAFVLIVIVFACNTNKDYHGDAMLNYPDMKVLLDQYLKPYQNEPYSYRKVVKEGNKQDTTYMKAKEVDWSTIESHFMKASLFDKKFDKQYKIEVLEDTITSTLTVMYHTLNPKNPTSKLSIKATQDNSQVLSIYAEVADKGFFVSEEYKLLYVNQRSIQIQESIKKPFSELKHKVTTYSFLN